METVMRTFQKIFGDCGCRRQHQSAEAELYGEYNLLQNHDKTTTTMPEKQSTKKKNKVAPHGYLCVYVGPERLRYVIKIEYASHPLFMAFLKDAADTKNGNSVHNDGPLFLPCDVEEFHEALSDIMIADFDSSVSDNIPTSSYPSRSANKHGWARRLFKIPTAFKSKLN
ncbi:hypothetical protein K1719_038326 [Acacia pycnantha]|nr:hypothetical protein K1719_038326 [Acacia pycnantha]